MSGGVICGHNAEHCRVCGPVLAARPGVLSRLGSERLLGVGRCSGSRHERAVKNCAFTRGPGRRLSGSGKAVHPHGRAGKPSSPFGRAGPARVALCGVLRA